MTSMDHATLKIDDKLVHHLVATQFPQWKNLPVRPVAFSGWDNRTFHLGEHMLVRMPSSSEYEAQVEKEQQWLPKLAPHLPLPIPAPLAVGKPAEGYPLHWSIYQWLDGETATIGRITNLSDFAISLGKFLIAFQSISSTGGPLPGLHSFYRGGNLAIYDDESRQAIAALKDKIDIVETVDIWEAALASKWSNTPVWVHGDISTGNLLVQEGRLSAVIDFGQLTIGDPACDLAIAWTLFKNESREAFRNTLALDSDTWVRGRGWALWKALIVYAQLPGTNHLEIENSKRILDEITRDYKQEN
jgi:aminoglycoside phosphotransferase (APT) family kinase protein